MRTCFAPGCKSGYNSQTETRALFSVPKDPDLLQKWKRAIPREDKELSAKCFVCELHFMPEHIIRHKEITMPDGNVYRTELVHVRLQPGVVPCIFPNLPSYLTRNKKRRKLPTPRECSAKKWKTCPELPVLGDNEQSVSNAGDGEIDNEDSPVSSGNYLLNSSSCAADGEINNEDSLAKSSSCLSVFEKLKVNVNEIKVPHSNWVASIIPGWNFVAFVEWDAGCNVTKRVVVSSDLSVKVFFGKVEVGCLGTMQVENMSDISEVLDTVNKMNVCNTILEESPAEGCLGYTSRVELGQSRRGVLRKKCQPCTTLVKKLHTNKIGTTTRKHSKLKAAVKAIKRKNSRLNIKVQKLREEIKVCRENCANSNKEVIENAIIDLPLSQQELVRSCLSAAKAGNPKSRRYTIQWIYECLLIRIKGRAVYEHLRKLLPLPCPETLRKYVTRIKGCYGFQNSVFQLLKRKAHLLPSEERRGVLLLDEMKLTETLTFDRKTLKIEGFTNLGNYTPLHQKDQQGDHALVLMFQPFRGSWVQSLACFLSKGCAPATVLHHLIIECIILMEKAGFHIDIVTTDGAAWNRCMWKSFHITEENVSCEHVFDNSRRLWFCSDFPHLIKNLRNFIIKHAETWTPDGVVKLRHWDAVLEMEKPLIYGLKVAPRLCYEDIHPKHYQKMNVGRAYRFFGEKTIAAMEIYESPILSDCQPTLCLMKRISKLIEIMSSRTPVSKPLKLGSEEEQFILNFLEYLTEWQRKAKAEGFYFLSDNTYMGFIISLKATLDMLQFLTSECQYQYLMTARLNQDALERFFGMMRGACGANDHPDSRLFIQLYKLISAYSLVKPPRGSNVEGGEMLTTLVNINDISEVSTEERVNQLQKSIDTFIENELGFDEENGRIFVEHNYFASDSSDAILSYVAGYVARKSARFTKCNDCINSLKSEEPCTRDVVINLLSKGHLIYPSSVLFNLIQILESVFLEELETSEICSNTLLCIASKLERKRAQLVGCDLHKEFLTEAIVRFYFISRMHFVCKRANSIQKDKREKTKLHRKQAKL